MPKRSAGLLVFRRRATGVEVFLVHPGGPSWAKKDDGAWSIPKGEYGDDEEPLQAAQREFTEETGQSVTGEFIPLGEVKQAGGKLVIAWAVEADVDESRVVSNTFTMEWPPRSGKSREFPEVDRAGWFTIEQAALKIVPAQARFLTSIAPNGILQPKPAS